MNLPTEIRAVLERTNRPLDVHEIAQEINDARKATDSPWRVTPQELGPVLRKLSARNMPKGLLPQHGYPFPYRKLNGYVWYLPHSPVGYKILGPDVVLNALPALQGIEKRALRVLRERHAEEFQSIVDDILTRWGLPELSEDAN